ncbi:hypothetical protein HZB02_04835 [Candidatus Woesearchaeota archaeon]|nr:hypothetical protein [Candidatus Woesearchaeota archaeon]
MALMMRWVRDTLEQYRLAHGIDPQEMQGESEILGQAIAERLLNLPYEVYHAFVESHQEHSTAYEGGEDAAIGIIAKGYGAIGLERAEAYVAILSSLNVPYNPEIVKGFLLLDQPYIMNSLGEPTLKISRKGNVIVELRAWKNTLNHELPPHDFIKAGPLYVDRHLEVRLNGSPSSVEELDRAKELCSTATWTGIQTAYQKLCAWFPEKNYQLHCNLP